MKPNGFLFVASAVFACGFAWGYCALCPTGVLAGSIPEETNINSRYTVEAVDLEGAASAKLSLTVRDELRRRVGEKFSPEAFERLAGLIRKELNARSVIHRLEKGSAPEHVRVTLQVNNRRVRIGAGEPSRLAYQSNQGLSGDLFLVAGGFRFGVRSNTDELTERFSGIQTGYEHKFLGDRLGLGFQFDTYHEKWGGATLAAIGSDPDVAGIYRNRTRFMPAMTYRPLEGLSLTVGMAVQSFESQLPAAQIGSANALVNTLRYQGDWRDGYSGTHHLKAEYDLRAATRLLSSDLSYSRNFWNARYVYKRNGHQLIASYFGGTLNGRAPLFERFVLGNTMALRGWNKYEIAPLGGSRVEHGSLEFVHRSRAAIFYDTGSIRASLRPGGEEIRHSAGAGFRGQNFFVYVAFPLREGRPEPVVITGTNF